MGKNMKKEDGVSPVIAVMLILGLTVVLLGMAAAIFMGITSNTTETIDTSFLHPTYEWDVIKIVYSPNGGTGPVPVDEGAPHELDESVEVEGQGDLNRAGYYFQYWSLNSDGTGDFSSNYNAGEFIVLNKYTVLYAIWDTSQRFVILYNYENEYATNIRRSDSGDKNEPITIHLPTSSDGRVFSHWVDNEGNEYTAGTTYNGEKGVLLKLTAVWGDIPSP